MLHLSLGVPPVAGEAGGDDGGTGDQDDGRAQRPCPGELGVGALALLLGGVSLGVRALPLLLGRPRLGLGPLALLVGSPAFRLGPLSLLLGDGACGREFPLVLSGAAARAACSSAISASSEARR